MSQKKLTKTLFGLAAAATLTAGAQASLIHISGQHGDSTEGLGLFEGTIEYTADITNNAQGLLTINLVNTTPMGIGGMITGFVFNIDSTDPQATAALSSGTHPFLGVTDHAAPPFGHSFDAGAALEGNWSGGGNPNPGVAVGDSGTFTFEVFAADAESLTPESFLAGPYDHNFVVRFRGMNDGGSDKVPGVPVNVVPAPGALGLMAVFGLCASRRRRSR